MRDIYPVRVRWARPRNPYLTSLVIAIAAHAFSSRPVRAGDVKETFDDGTVKIHYHTDTKNRKTGTYEEFNPNGKISIRGQYLAGKKNGQWSIFGDKGKLTESISYSNGLRSGPYLWNFPSGKPGLRAVYSRGQLAGPLMVLDEKGTVTRRISYPRSRAQVEKAFLTLYPQEPAETKFTTEPHVEAPYKAGVLSDRTLAQAIKVTQLYRYLSGLPWQDLKIDPGLCDTSAHGAVILAKLGKLTHTPEKPADMDEAFYKRAYLGCSKDNLNMGSPSPGDAVRGFMDDSDDSNVTRIGHRQWVLSPGLQHVGFGSADKYVSMYVFDGTRPVKLDYNFFAFPGEGFYPAKLVEAHYAWSLHVNNTRAKVGTANSVSITIQKLDVHYQPDGDAAPASVVSVNREFSASFGWTVIVFKPGLTDAQPARYWVEVSGIKSASGARAPFGYIVDLIDIQPPAVPSATPLDGNCK
ncbi:MAG TPA: hypothetical protein VFC78_24220 [Tepidisphaeraceae bacterium]|nr:hypothetical protein [Tepidisphaeraceae bacterium]